jgi:Tfp pilus assembly protein PilF
VCSRTGKPEQAEKELRNALQLDPKMTKAHLALVNLYLQQRRSPDAVFELKEFLKAAPNDAFAPKAREVLKKLESQSALNVQSH